MKEIISHHLINMKPYSKTHARHFVNGLFVYNLPHILLFNHIRDKASPE